MKSIIHSIRLNIFKRHLKNRATAQALAMAGGAA